jgi:hypothetical protein
MDTLQKHFAAPERNTRGKNEYWELPRKLTS